MVEYLGADPFQASEDCRTTNGSHEKLSTLKNLYEEHLVVATGAKDEGDEVFV